jgi:hypothetical protein
MCTLFNDADQPQEIFKIECWEKIVISEIERTENEAVVVYPRVLPQTE